MLKELPFNKNDILGYMTCSNRLQLRFYLPLVFVLSLVETLPYSTYGSFYINCEV